MSLPSPPGQTPLLQRPRQSQTAGLQRVALKNECLWRAQLGLVITQLRLPGVLGHIFLLLEELQSLPSAFFNSSRDLMTTRLHELGL